eukprot:1644692-Lingulodinium_polyedra.AAC.1
MTALGDPYCERRTGARCIWRVGQRAQNGGPLRSARGTANAERGVGVLLRSARRAANAARGRSAFSVWTANAERGRSAFG